MFELHEQLKHDTVLVGKFKLSLVLLHRDANYPWCILVPQQPGLSEIYHLSYTDQRRLLAESSHLAQVMSDLFSAKKMNIASLGNVVPQLHIHHVARCEGDPAWPNPIWGAVEPKSYSPSELSERLVKIRVALAGEGFQTAEQP